MVRFDFTAEVSYDLDAGTVNGSFYEAEPPTYDAGGASTLTIRGTITCDDGSFPAELRLERHGWILMAATGRLPVSDDGCTCEGVYGFSLGGVSGQYDWKLEKVPDE